VCTRRRESIFDNMDAAAADEIVRLAACSAVLSHPHLAITKQAVVAAGPEFDIGADDVSVLTASFRDKRERSPER